MGLLLLQQSLFVCSQGIFDIKWCAALDMQEKMCYTNMSYNA